jgi:transposase-like protein
MNWLTRKVNALALKQQCPFCVLETIPRRVMGFYVGSPNRVQLWECRECKSLWSEKTTFIHTQA